LELGMRAETNLYAVRTHYARRYPFMRAQNSLCAVIPIYTRSELIMRGDTHLYALRSKLIQ